MRVVVIYKLHQKPELVARSPMRTGRREVFATTFVAYAVRTSIAPEPFDDPRRGRDVVVALPCATRGQGAGGHQWLPCDAQGWRIIHQQCKDACSFIRLPCHEAERRVRV